MAPRIEFTGRFEPSPRMNIVPGAWYLGFRCEVCGNSVAVLDDPTSSGVIEMGGDGIFDVQCPSCGEARGYPASRMMAWQATTGHPGG